MAIKTTVYLEEQLARQLEQCVAPRKLNKFINEAVAEKVERLDRERLDAEMKAGYLAVAEQRGKLAEDWSTVDLEDWPS